VGLALTEHKRQPSEQNGDSGPDKCTNLNYNPAIATTGNVLTC
jgi:hypothetical protein